MADNQERLDRIAQYPFEKAMARLEEVVEELEKGEIPLEEAIGLYQEGILLARHCDVKLKQVEERIEMLTEENGEMMLKELTPEEGSHHE